MLLHERKKDDKKLVDLLKRHIDLEYDFLQLLRNNEMQLEPLLQGMQRMKLLRSETLEAINIEEHDTFEEEDIVENETMVIIKEREFTKEVNDGYIQSKNELASVYNAISNNRTPVLNLDIIKDFIVKISPLFKTVFYIPEIDINGTIVLSKVENKYPLILKNGRKAIITCKNIDFTSFNYEELIEILRFFDVLVSDTSLDHIRSELVKHIASISSVSYVK